MIKAAIFDLDGLLIDSEKSWQEAERSALAKVGVMLTQDMVRETTGLRTDEVVAHWQTAYPWHEPSAASVANNLDRIAYDLLTHALPMPGAAEAIAKCRSYGLLLAIASSSPVYFIESAMMKLGLPKSDFVVASARQTRYGKPHPEVFIAASVELGLRPMECVAFEDSIAGVVAAKAARMKCVAVPADHEKSEPAFGVADVVLDNLLMLTEPVLADIVEKSVS